MGYSLVGKGLIGGPQNDRGGFSPSTNAGASDFKTSEDDLIFFYFWFNFWGEIFIFAHCVLLLRDFARAFPPSGSLMSSQGKDL